MSLYDMSQKIPSEPVLLILASLAQGPRHGYAIMRDVAGLSEGRVQLSTGTLFGAIRRLLEEGWIEPYEEADAPRGRKAYKLARPGRTVLNAELARMKAMTRIVSSRLASRNA